MATVRELYEPAMKIETQQEANDYFKYLVEEHIKLAGGEYLIEAEKIGHANPGYYVRYKSEAVVRDNLGYFAGYYSHATRLRVERLFGCEHPIMGPASQGQPDADKIFSAGMAAGKAMKKGASHAETVQRAREVIRG